MLVSFLIMGDWGGTKFWPYVTLPELSTASGMGKLATEKNATFALALGDNVRKMHVS